MTRSEEPQCTCSAFAICKGVLSPLYFNVESGKWVDEAEGTLFPTYRAAVAHLNEFGLEPIGGRVEKYSV